jgi:hypothetical protein
MKKPQLQFDWLMHPIPGDGETRLLARNRAAMYTRLSAGLFRFSRGYLYSLLSGNAPFAWAGS